VRGSQNKFLKRRSVMGRSRTAARPRADGLCQELVHIEEIGRTERDRD
jgi:hypothetical protein